MIEKPTPGAAEALPALPSEEVIHPYVGVVLDPDRDPLGRVSRMGFQSGNSSNEIWRASDTLVSDTLIIGIFGGSFATGIHNQTKRVNPQRLARQLGVDGVDQRLAAAVLEVRDEIDRSAAGHTRFVLVRKSLPCLSQASISADILESLKPLQDRPFDTRNELQRAVVDQLGAKRATEVKEEGFTRVLPPTPDPNRM